MNVEKQFLVEIIAERALRVGWKKGERERDNEMLTGYMKVIFELKQQTITNKRHHNGNCQRQKQFKRQL